MWSLLSSPLLLCLNAAAHLGKLHLQFASLNLLTINLLLHCLSHCLAPKSDVDIGDALAAVDQLVGPQLFELAVLLDQGLEGRSERIEPPRRDPGDAEGRSELCVLLLTTFGRIFSSCWTPVLNHRLWGLRTLLRFGLSLALRLPCVSMAYPE